MKFLNFPKRTQKLEKIPQGKALNGIYLEKACLNCRQTLMKCQTQATFKQECAKKRFSTTARSSQTEYGITAKSRKDCIPRKSDSKRCPVSRDE